MGGADGGRMTDKHFVSNQLPMSPERPVWVRSRVGVFTTAYRRGPEVMLWEVCRPDLVTPVTRRSRKPLGRIVGKPLNCHSRANSRDTGLWEVAAKMSFLTLRDQILGYSEGGGAHHKAAGSRFVSWSTLFFSRLTSTRLPYPG